MENLVSPDIEELKMMSKTLVVLRLGVNNSANVFYLNILPDEIDFIDVSNSREFEFENNALDRQ